MKKTIFKTTIVLFSVSLLLTGCSKDDDNGLTDNSILQRTAGEIYPQFADLLHEKYSDSYDVKESKEIKDGELTYIVSEVYAVIEEVEVLKGYFIEDKDKQQVVYLEEVKATGHLLHYEYETGVGYKMTEYDLTKDAAYNDLGFSPKQPDEAVYGKRKFFGTVTSNCHNEDIGGGCSQTVCTYTSYIFWLKYERLIDIPTGQVSCM